MSLDFRVTEIQDYEDNFPTIEVEEFGAKQQVWHPTTQTLVWGAFAIGMQQITEKNYTEFFRRLHMWYDTFGDECSITMKDVRLHIGLSTNVTNMSQAEFKQHVAQAAERKAREAAYRAERG